MSHYQLSFTRRQAMGFFLAALAALAVSFFLGLMAGLSGRSEPPREASRTTPAAVSEAGSPAPSPAVRKPVDRRAAPVAAAASEPTAPASLQTFEDAGEEPAEGGTAAEAPKSATAPAPAVSDAAGPVWIQVASLTQRPEAEALLARLAKRGMAGSVEPASGPRGRVFRVRVGPFRTEDEARRASDLVRREARVARVWIVKEGR